MVKAIWTRERVLLKIVNFSRIGYAKSRLLESRIFITTLCTISLGIAFTRLLNVPSAKPLGMMDSLEITETGLLNDFRHNLWVETKYMFFVKNGIEQSSQIGLMLQSLTALALVCKFIMGGFSDLFILMNVLTLHNRVGQFEEILDAKYPDVKLQKLQIDMVLTNYEALQELAKLINKSVGDVFIYFIGEGIFAYAMALRDILGLETVGRAVVLGFYDAIVVWILIAAASICRKVCLAYAKPLYVKFLVSNGPICQF